MYQMIFFDQNEIQDLTMDAITTIMDDLKSEVPELSMYEGLGHCIYGSKLLDEQLKAQGIDSCILAGTTMLRTNETFDMRQATKRIVLSMTDDNKIFSNMRKAFVKRGNTFSPTSGHAVVLVEDTIYDITSGQFGLPRTYRFDQFLSYWNEIRKIEVTKGIKPEKFLINGIKTTHVYNKASHKFVDHAKRSKANQLSSEGFFNW